MNKSYVYVILAVVLVTALLVLSGVAVGSKIIGSSGGPVQSVKGIDETPVIGGSDDAIAIPGFEKLVMKAGQAKQAVNFYNPDTNTCYFRISLSLEDGTELYRSGMIKPGQTINTIEISHILKAGIYNNSVLQYDCYTLEDLQPLNGSKTVLNLEVKP